MTEHIFIVGATGNVGSNIVRQLLEKKSRVTIYVRNPAKATDLFPGQESLLSIVQGDYSDLTPFNNAITKGFTRLLLLVQVDRLDMSMAELKSRMATAAYNSGVKQVVDISSYCAGERWRNNCSSADHWASEKALLEIPNRGRLVCLRPGRFMSNIVNFDKYSINQQNAYPGSSDPSETIAWVSPRDISTVAARILTDSIEKHQDSVYEMIGQAMTASQTGEVISKVLDRNVPYVQVEPLERYRLLTEVAHLPHRGAYFLVNLNENGVHTSRGLDILLGRKPETLEEYLTAHKHQFD